MVVWGESWNILVATEVGESGGEVVPEDIPSHPSHQAAVEATWWEGLTLLEEVGEYEVRGSSDLLPQAVSGADVVE